MQYLKQSTLATIMVGPAVAIADSVTPVTDLAIGTVDEIGVYKHDGTTLVDISGTSTLTHRAGGLYTLTLSTVDTDTLGRVIVYIRDDTACYPIREEFSVLAANVYDSLVGGGDSLEVDAVAISGATTPADNLELQYDGSTGLDGGPFPATQSQIGLLSTGSSSIGKNASAFTLTTGSNEVNTYAVTDEANEVYHTFEDNGGTSDAYYEFNVGGNGVGGSIEWVGYAQSWNDNWGLFVYDWIDSSWKQLGSVKPENNIKVKSVTLSLSIAHTGTGANLGLVRFRPYSIDGTLFATDRVLCNLAIVQNSGDGAIWVDTLAGVAGTEKGVNGIPNNPVLTWADALTLAAAQGTDNFHISNGSTIQLTGNSDHYSFQGHNWNLDLNGQSIASMFVAYANIYGTGTGTAYRFISSKIAATGAISLQAGGMQDCGIGSMGITLSAAGTYLMDGCFAMTAGTSAPTIDFEAAGEDKMLSISNWQGDIEFEHFGNATHTHSALVSGVGHGTFNANCDAATAGDTLDAHGAWVVVDNVVGGWQGEFSVEGDVISQQTKAQTDLDTLTENITIDAIVTGVLAGVVEGSVDVQEALNRIMACIVNSVDIETGVSSNTYTFKDSSGVSTVVEHIITSNGSSRELS